MKKLHLIDILSSIDDDQILEFSQEAMTVFESEDESLMSEFIDKFDEIIISGHLSRSDTISCCMTAISPTKRSLVIM